VAHCPRPTRTLPSLSPIWPLFTESYRRAVVPRRSPEEDCGDNEVILTANLARMLAPAPSPKHTTSLTLNRHKHAYNIVRRYGSSGLASREISWYGTRSRVRATLHSRCELLIALSCTSLHFSRHRLVKYYLLTYLLVSESNRTCDKDSIYRPQAAAYIQGGPKN